MQPNYSASSVANKGAAIARCMSGVGVAPREGAGINLNLGENKTENLMRQAAIHARGTAQASS